MRTENFSMGSILWKHGLNWNLGAPTYFAHEDQDMKHVPRWNTALKINHTFPLAESSLTTLKMSSLVFNPQKITAATKWKGLSLERSLL